MHIEKVNGVTQNRNEMFKHTTNSKQTNDTYIVKSDISNNSIYKLKEGVKNKVMPSF